MGRVRALGSAALFCGFGFLAGSALADPDAGTPLPTRAAPDGVRAEAVCTSPTRQRADGPVQASVADEDLARWNVGGTSAPGYVSNRPGYHVAPRVRVDTWVRPRVLPDHSSRKGVLSEVAVLAQTRNHGYWPFRLCFEDGLRGDQKLRGRLLFRMVIERDGLVRTSRLVSTDSKDQQTARCVAARAQKLKFSPPPARRVGVDVSVELNPGDAPVPGLGIAPPGTPEPEPLPPPPPVDARRLEETLDGSLAAATACFATGRARDAHLWGRIGLRAEVDRHGNVTVREHESRFPDPEVVRCTIAAVAAQPIAAVVTGPRCFTWGLRFGSPPQPVNTTNLAENKAAGEIVHSAVAESPTPRVPLSR